jgi:hypothetical protein
VARDLGGVTDLARFPKLLLVRRVVERLVTHKDLLEGSRAFFGRAPPSELAVADCVRYLGVCRRPT